MNDMRRTDSELDLLLARLFGGLDAGPDFQRRLDARLARERAPDTAVQDVRERLQTEHAQATAHLRRGLRRNILATAGTAIGALPLAWLVGGFLGHALGGVDARAVTWLVGASVALTALWIGTALERIAPGLVSRSLPA